jgi:hypothetical protein
MIRTMREHAREALSKGATVVRSTDGGG